MFYLSVEEIRFCHDTILSETLLAIERRTGVVTESDRLANTPGEFAGKLESIVDTLLYPPNKEYSIYNRISYFIHLVCTLHPFIEGNKRTAFFVASTILASNGLNLRVSLEEADQVLIAVAKGDKTVTEIKKWLMKRCHRLILSSVILLLIKILYRIMRHAKDISWSRVQRSNNFLVQNIRTFVDTIESK